MKKKKGVSLEFVILIVVLVFTLYYAFYEGNSSTETSPVVNLESKGPVVKIPSRHLGLNEISKENVDQAVDAFTKLKKPSSNLDLRSASFDEQIISGSNVITSNQKQFYEGIPVIGKNNIYIFRDDSLVYYTDNLVSDESLEKINLNSIISFVEAQQIAVEHIGDVDSISFPRKDSPNGLIIETRFGNDPLLVYEIFVSNSVDDYKLIIEAHTGSIISSIGTRASENVYGNIISEKHDPLFEVPLRDQNVKIYDSTGTILLGQGKTDENGDYLISEIPPGNALIDVRFQADNINIFKTGYPSSSPVSVLQEPIIVQSGSGANFDIDWRDYEVDVPNNVQQEPHDYAESNVYYHMADLINTYRELGINEVDDYLLQANLELPTCVIASASAGLIIRLTCGKPFDIHAIVHETAHLIGFTIGLDYARYTYDWILNFPYSDWENADHTQALHEGFADYTRISTVTGAGGPSVPANFLNFHVTDDWSAHDFGDIIEAEGTQLENIIGVDETRTLISHGIRLGPKNWHQLARNMFDLDQIYYGGVNQVDICDGFGDANVIISECMPIFSGPGPFILSDFDHEPFTRPVGEVVDFDLEVYGATFYNIDYAPMAQNVLDYAPIAGGPISNNYQTISHQFDTSSLPDDVYKIRFRASIAGNNFEQYKLLQISSEKPGWPVEGDRPVRQQRITHFDVDGDGDREVFFATSPLFQSVTTFHAYNSDGTSLDNFPIVRPDLSGNIHVFTVIYDINSDGNPDLLGSGSSRLLSFGVDGSPQFVPFTGGNGQSSGIVFSDLNQDGSEEFIVSHSSTITPSQGRLVAYTYDGGEYAQWGFTPYEGYIEPPAFADLMGGPELEVIAPTAGGLVRIYNYLGQSQNVDNWPLNLDTQPLANKPAIGDVDNDGNLEIVLSALGQVVIIDAQGNIKAQFGSASRGSSVALANIDSDNDLEIFVSNEEEVNGYHHDGSLVSSYPTNGWIRYEPADTFGLPPSQRMKCTVLEQSPVLGDVDGDGLQEIFFRGDDGCPYVFGYNVDGTLIPGWPKPLDFFPSNLYQTGINPGDFVHGSSTPVITDIDGDGLTDLLVGAQKRVHVFEFSGNYNPSLNEWPEFGHDWKGSGNYEYVLVEDTFSCSDEDSDGFESALCGGLDCDDSNPDVYPGAPELCSDNIDNQCSGDIGFGDVDCGDVQCSGSSACLLNCGDASDCPYVACSNVECNSGMCEYSGTPGASCSDGIACDVGTCGGPGGFVCQGVNEVDCGLAECADNPICLFACEEDSDCADTNLCTVDQCISGSCSYSLVPAGTSCSDGNWCNGDETCSLVGICSSGTLQCSGSQTCDEDLDICEDGIEVNFNSDVSAVQNGDQIVFSAEVNCNVADCGDVDLTLDPIKKEDFNLLDFTKNIFS